MKKQHTLLLFGFLGGLIMMSLYIAPVIISSYNTTTSSREYTVIGKNETRTYVPGQAYDKIQYYLYMEPPAEILVEQSVYNIINRGDSCSITFKKGEFTENRASQATCNGIEVPRFEVIESSGK